LSNPDALLGRTVGIGKNHGVRVVLIVNAAASSVTARRRDRVLRHLSLGHDVDVVTTDRRGHATALAQDAVASGVGALAVLGGDGTLNEAAAALVGSDCILAPLPGGSTNVFVRSMGLPRDLVSAAEVAGRALTVRSVDRIGVGEVVADGAPPRAFLCHTGVGWDAALVAEVERLRHRPPRWTRPRRSDRESVRPATVPMYVVAGLRTFAKGWDRRTPQLSVDDGAGVPYDGSFAIVQNGDPYTFVGPRPLRVAIGADRHHGLFATTITTMSSPVFLGALGHAMGRSGVSRGRGLQVAADLDSLEISAAAKPDGGGDGVPYQVDGDHLGSARCLAFRHLPATLSVVTPPT